MPGQTILQSNNAFMNTAADMWRSVIGRNITPIDPPLPDPLKISSKRHRTAEQYAAEYWKARRRVEQVINAIRIDSNGEDRRFVKAVARQHIFDHTSCSVYFGSGSEVSGVSFVHLFKSRDGTFQTPQATFIGEAGARMAAANILFFDYNGTSIPEALFIYANRTIDGGPFDISYRGPKSFHYAWAEQGCTQEEMRQVPTRVQKNALRAWFRQEKFETARWRIARVLNSNAYKKIKNAVTAHESWCDTAFSGLNRVQLEFAYRPWRNPNLLSNGASNSRLPCLAYPLDNNRMAVGIPEGVNLAIDGMPKQGVHVIRSGAILERGARRLLFSNGKLTIPNSTALSSAHQ